MTVVALHDHWPEQECTSTCPDNCPNCGQDWNAGEIRDRAVELLRGSNRRYPTHQAWLDAIDAFLAELDATDPEGS